MAQKSPATNAEFMQRLARRTKLNEQSTLAFIASILAIVAAFIVVHLLRLYGEGMQSARDEAKKPSALTVLSRKLKRVTLRRGPGLPSVGHAVLIGVYLAINIAVAFTNLENDKMSAISNIASRAAWLAIANMVVVVILALKNTPLSFLTSHSYERLNVLHRVAGYTTITLIIIHASCYCAYFVQSSRIDILLRTEQIFGMVAGLSLLMLGLGGTVIRRNWYELFYLLHITFWLLALVAVGFHQPNLGSKIIIAPILAGTLWLLDRFIRLIRLALYSTNNSVTLTPLSNGTTRVTLAKRPAHARPGKHCYLWIPKIRSFEMHPFTITTVDPLEFVVQSRDGFTRDLHKHAVSSAGVTLRASVEGPYGTIPDPAEYDKVVMVAGGSGASFTVGMALRMLEKLDSGESRQIVFIWAAQKSTCLEWFSRHLDTLREDNRVSINLFVTRQAMSQLTRSVSTASLKHSAVTSTSEIDTGKLTTYNSEPQRSSMSIDSEKYLPPDTETSTNAIDVERPRTYHGTPITYARPDVATMIRTAVHETPANKRVLVLGCGPRGLMTEVRNTTAACILEEGPSVDLHIETFGW